MNLMHLICNSKCARTVSRLNNEPSSIDWFIKSSTSVSTCVDCCGCCTTAASICGLVVRHKFKRHQTYP